MTVAEALSLALAHPQELPRPSRVALPYAHPALAQHGGNVSATARALGMDRRSLQRMLGKRARI